jgi:hypothetical protein
MQRLAKPASHRRVRARSRRRRWRGFAGSAVLRRPGGAAGSGVRQQRCPGAAVHVTNRARPITVRLHDDVVFSVDVVFSALFAENTTSTEKATSKA